MILFDNSYFVLGKNFKISDYLTVHNPTLGSVLEIGEDKYHQLLNRFVSKPWDQKVGLFEMGIDFEDIEDIEFFASMLRELDVSDSKILFGDFDFSKLQLYRDEKTKEFFLGCVEYSFLFKEDNLFDFKTTDKNKALEYIQKNRDNISDCLTSEIVIDKLSYELMSDFLRKIHHIPISEKPKYGSKHAKEYMLKMEMDKLKYSKKEHKNRDSQLVNMISFLANTGNGYTYENIPKMKLSTFYDAVMRTKRIKHSSELLTGVYAGTEAIMRYAGKSLMDEQDQDELDCLGSLEVLSDFEKLRKRRSVNADTKDEDKTVKHSFGTKKFGK